MKRGSLIVAAAVCLMATTACTTGFVAGQGTVNGTPWRVTAYPKGDEVCFMTLEGQIGCDSLRPDQATSIGWTSFEGSAIETAAGVVRPDVATLRINVDGVTQDLATVAVPFRSDIRLYAAAFPITAQPQLLDTFDAQGNVLEQLAKP